MEDNRPDKQLRNNPFFVIGIASMLAITMTAISILMYYGSDTRDVVEQLQANLQDEAYSQPSADASIDINSLDGQEKRISESVNALDDEADFGASELSDSALGL
jgi:cell division protein FtsX